MARRRIHTGGSTIGAKAALQRRTRNTNKISVSDGQVLDLDLGAGLVISKLAGNYPANFFRYSKYTHISDLIYKCNRMIALSYASDIKIHGEPLYDSQAICFAIGRTIESFIVDKIIKNHSSEVYGRWSCRCLGKKEDYTPAEGLRPTEDCSTCHSPYTKYDELLLTNDEFMISGSVDITLLIANALYFIELKSIKHEYWLELERPQPEHLIQVLFYWWLAKELGYSIHKTVSVVYTSKNFIFGSPYKEFVIEPSEHIHLLDPYLEEAEELKVSRYGDGTRPPRTCPEALSPKAKKCEMAALCFGWDDNND